jgi:hypothetical protein
MERRRSTMRRLLVLSTLLLVLSGGVALANPGRGGGGTVRDHRAFVGNGRPTGGWNGDGRSNRGSWSGGVNVGPAIGGRAGWNGGNARWNGGDHGYSGGSRARGPIYMPRPIIRQRYSNYYQRPSLIAESYGAMPGYSWVAGAWLWNGYEWIWQPGHYQPDPGYTTYRGY